ncbi:MAG TPA: ester cyclase [Actinoplanes sp.]|jgi:steroid delta-isomerase-like uncharacterized protein|nr:ester cyclase [Actinoplanes sp.]
MSPDEHKAIIREHVEVLFNQHRVDLTDQTVAADYLDHAPLPGQMPGLEGAQRKWAAYLNAVPDMHATIEDMVAEGDEVAVRWTVQGIHRGELLGIPATGRRAVFRGISIYRLAETKIVEQWEQWDRLDLLQQLGVIPKPGQATASTRPATPDAVGASGA